MSGVPFVGFRRPRAFVLGVAVLVGAALAGRAQERTLGEYQIKALFLFNLVQFVEWPPSAFPAADTPIRIGVLGDSPFDGALDAAIKGEKVGGRSLIVVQAREATNLEGCHVVFVSRSERGRLSPILAAFGGKPVLTVGDFPDFAERGGVLNFYRDGEKVRFELNRAAARAANLKLAAQLARLARLVGPEGGER